MTHRRGFRAAVSTLCAVSLLAVLAGITAGVNFNPGQNGHPTSGDLTDLGGRDLDVSFEFQSNALVDCTANNTATMFTLHLDYVVSGDALPPEAGVVVYLSPNQDAIDGNSGGDPLAYIAAVESNETTVSMAGLSGSATLTFNLPVSSAFTLSSGGVVGVIANVNANADIDWDTQTNPLNCAEARPTPTPTATVTPTPFQSFQGQTATPTIKPTQTPFQSFAGATATAATTAPTTSTGSNGSSNSSAQLFALLICLALGGIGLLAAEAQRRAMRG